MDIESLNTFLEVERAKSFTRASEILFCTQAAISLRIKRLEQDLGCQLFDRRCHTVALTRDGMIFLPYARHMYNTWTISREHLLQHHLEQSEVEFACSGSLGTYLVPSLIYLFRQKYPYISVHNNIDYTKNVIAVVGSGAVPLGVVPCPALALISNEQFLCLPLVEEPLVLVTAPDHPWARDKGVYLRELKRETLLFPGTGAPLVPLLEELGGCQFNPDQIHYSGNIETVKHGVCNKSGVSVLSEYAVRPELELGRLRQIPILDTVRPSRQVYSLRRRSSNPVPLVKLFLDFVAEASIKDQLPTRCV